MTERGRLPAKETFSRTVAGPNGVEYLLAIPGWYWNALDWLTANGYWREDDFYKVAWKLAREVEDTYDIGGHGGFQGVLARSLQGVIWVKWTKTMNQINGISNDSIGIKDQ